MSRGDRHRAGTGPARAGTGPARRGAAVQHGYRVAGHEPEQAGGVAGGREPSAADGASIRASSSQRAPWFEVSCCPPNVARTLASLNALLATVDENGVQLHQYAPCTIRAELPGGQPVGLELATAYPRDGLVRVRVSDDADEPWTLTLRVPAWAGRSTLVTRPVDGPESVRPVDPGSADVRRRFLAGDVVELQLPMPAWVSRADPRADAVRGCVVVERGPLVFCLESVDLSAATGGQVDDVAAARLDLDRPPRVVNGDVVVDLRLSGPSTGDWPYRPDGTDPVGSERVEVRLTPYHAWAERGPSTMRVWLPVAEPGAEDRS
jgi:DUF1680 family protein